MAGNDIILKNDRLGLIVPFFLLWLGLNDYTDAVDYKLTSKGCCGQDVTKKLNALLNDVTRRLKAEKYKYIFPVNFELYTNLVDGWDIYEFSHIANTDELISTCKGVGCDLTVAYDGKCVKVTALNYVLWGLVAAAKDYHDNNKKLPEYVPNFGTLHLQLAAGYTFFLKRAAHDETEPVGLAGLNKTSFVISGYFYFWLNHLSVPPLAVYENCQVIPNNEYKGDLTAQLDLLGKEFSGRK